MRTTFRFAALALLLLLPACGNAAVNRSLRPYREAVKAEPENAVALYDLGAAALSLEQYKEARKSLERCLEVEPDHVEALVKLSKAYDALDQLSRADECLRHVIAQDSTHLEANELMANRNISLILVFEQLGQREEPNKKTGITPTQQRILNVTHQSLEEFRHRYDESVFILERLVRIEPENLYNWCNLGAIRNQVGDFKGSEEAYEYVRKANKEFLVDKSIHNSISSASRLQQKYVLPPMPRFLVIGDYVLVITP